MRGEGGLELRSSYQKSVQPYIVHIIRAFLHGGAQGSGAIPSKVWTSPAPQRLNESGGSPPHREAHGAVRPVDPSCLGERRSARPAFPLGVRKAAPGPQFGRTPGREVLWCLQEGLDRKREGVGPLGERRTLRCPRSAISATSGLARQLPRSGGISAGSRQQGAPTSRVGVPGPESRQRPSAAGAASNPAARPPSRRRVAPCGRGESQLWRRQAGSPTGDLPDGGSSARPASRQVWAPPPGSRREEAGKPGRRAAFQRPPTCLGKERKCRPGRAGEGEGLEAGRRARAERRRTPVPRSGSPEGPRWRAPALTGYLVDPLKD
ncbi:basic salivary proline-rich protein 3-like [Acanthaster planci]|uniref:Basic salivary proline-rich protein 3-like n=1 Tax=Acanthaster planci TaxID=133434 RepID=A0A8B7ZQC7_ACAPL|nr:basic salivary proline-rich protein 3-like [Acanthaster planci]